MKKVAVYSILSFALLCLCTSAKAQSQNTCYAYGHHKVACPGSADQKTVSTKEKTQDKKEDQKTEKQVNSSSSTQTINKKKYNASEFKTKRYFFKSL